MRLSVRIDAWDRRVVRELHAKMESRALRRIAIAFTFLAYGWNWFLLAPMSLVPAWYPAVARLGGALIVTWCALMLIRVAFPRVRPFRAMNLRAWWGASKSASFPSGHAGGAFAIAAFFACWLSPCSSARDAIVVGVLVLLATGAALSRVALAVHYPSDVVAGGILGATCGIIAAHVPL